MRIRDDYAFLSREEAKIAIHNVFEGYSGNLTESIDKVRELAFVMDVLSKRENGENSPSE